MTDLDKAMISALSEYIRIDTSNPPGDCSGAATFLEQLLKEFGFHTFIDGVSEEKPSILSNLGGEAVPGIVLLHHMDVVPALKEEWSFPPFSGDLRDGNVLGRGTLDTKGLGIAQIFGAIKASRELGGLKKKVLVIANPDEEVGGDEGAGYFMKQHGERVEGCFGLNEGGIGVKDLFGPGNFFLVNMWEKGPVWLRLVSRGRAGHGSRPTPGDSTARLVRGLHRLLSFEEDPELTGPVKEMLVELEKCGVISLDRKGKSSIPTASELKKVSASVPEMEAIMRDTFAVTMLNAGFKPNVIPAEAEASLDVRILPGRKPGDVIEKIRKILDGLDLELEVLYSATPSGSERTKFFNIIEDALLSVYPGSVVLPYLSTGFTDSRFLRNKGVTTYGLLPSVIPREELGRIHGVDERISVESVIKASEVIKGIVMRMERE